MSTRHYGRYGFFPMSGYDHERFGRNRRKGPDRAKVNGKLVLLSAASESELDERPWPSAMGNEDYRHSGHV